jgi:hypothetical protein
LDLALESGLDGAEYDSSEHFALQALWSGAAAQGSAILGSAAAKGSEILESAAAMSSAMLAGGAAKGSAIPESDCVEQHWHVTRHLLVHGATGFVMRGSCSMGPRGFVVKAPVEFDSMGPRWVVNWIPGWAQLREKGGEESCHLRRSVN